MLMQSRRVRFSKPAYRGFVRPCVYLSVDNITSVRHSVHKGARALALSAAPVGRRLPHIWHCSASIHKSIHLSNIILFVIVIAWLACPLPTSVIELQ